MVKFIGKKNTWSSRGDKNQICFFRMQISFDDVDKKKY